MKFSKWQGLGNDFILVEAADLEGGSLPELARRMCDRHFGIGADGLVVAGKGEKAAFSMRIFNPDGSEPEMCGNAIRCFALHVLNKGLTQETRMEVETLAGVIRPEVCGGQVKVNMGKPRLRPEEIPLVGVAGGQVVAAPVEVPAGEFAITCVSMGNPHAVIFVEDMAAAPVETAGPQLEVAPMFPRKTNVEFVQVIDPTTLRMRVWERGAGPTLACGTGACATLVAAVLNNKVARKAKVILDGGPLEIEWAEDGRVWMTGPATHVFEGEWSV